MRKLLIAALTVLALGAFASPTFADAGGTPNSHASVDKGKAHDGHGNSAGGNGSDTDPQSTRGND